jgi:hypothetical protein
VPEHDPARLPEAVAVLVDTLGMSADEALIAIHAWLTVGGKITKELLDSIIERLEACGATAEWTDFTSDRPWSAKIYAMELTLAEFKYADDIKAARRMINQSKSLTDTARRQLRRYRHQRSP